MEMQSSGTLSDILSGFVKHLIDKKDSSVAIPVIQKSAIEKPTSNPCEILHNVASQDTIRPSQAEIVEPNFPSKSTETKFSTSTLGGQQNIVKGSGCTTTGLTGYPTGLTASSRVSPNNSKPKMVKPKKPEIGVWKTVESKGRHKHQKEKPKPFLGDLPAKSRKQNTDASRLKHPKHSRSTPRQQFHDRNRQTNNFPNSVPFSSHRSSTHIPYGSYYSMPCFYPSWYFNSYMPSLPTYLCPNYITYREPAISKPPPTNNGRFDPKKSACADKETHGDQASLSCQKRWAIE